MARYGSVEGGGHPVRPFRDQVVHVSFTITEREAIDRLAQERGWNRSQAVREAVRIWAESQAKEETR